MNKLARLAALATVLTLASSAAVAAATLTYVNTERLTDVPRFKADRDGMDAALLEHFNKLASKLPDGQELKIEIIDIDLAGDVFPRVAIQDVRVMRGRADWPKIHLRYSIEQDGKVLRSGEERLSDSSYMMRGSHYNTELYKYEKQLLDDWFRRNIVAAR